MSLVLNIYTKKSSKLTADSFREKLAAYPNVQPIGKGEFQYENENTHVYCIIGNEAPEEPVKNFTSLDMTFNINYLRPSFFGLELFEFIEKIVNDNDLLLDNEQEGAPSKFNRQRMYKEWLRVNDAGYKHVLEAPDRGEGLQLAYQPRDISQRQWKFLYHLDELQEESGDVYVARLFYFKDESNKLVTAAAWPDCIPITMPPATDYFIIMENKKKLFKKVLIRHGMIKVDTLLKHFASSFVKAKDGSYSLDQQQADTICTQVMALKADLPDGEYPGMAIAPDKIVDAPGIV